jgi:hypothetical protein
VIVVSDTSPITSLADVDQLGLLRLLFGSVVIPREVHGELERGNVKLPAWLEVRDVVDRAMVVRLGAELDDGEAEALVLAVELQAERVLIDELKARAVAARLGLRYVGVLGILLEAKQRGHLAAIRPVLENLVDKAGFWLSEELLRGTLQAAGEG